MKMREEGVVGTEATWRTDRLSKRCSRSLFPAGHLEDSFAHCDHCNLSTII